MRHGFAEDTGGFGGEAGFFEQGKSAFEGALVVSFAKDHGGSAARDGVAAGDCAAGWEGGAGWEGEKRGIGRVKVGRDWEEVSGGRVAAVWV